MSVLVVDDEEAVLHSVSVLLQSMGHDVVAFESAEHLLASKLPDHGCVLTDLFLSGLSGLQLHAALGAIGSPLSVIVMSGKGDVPAAVQALKAGVVDFLEKPCDPTVLGGAITIALSKSERRSLDAVEETEARRLLDGLTPREREVFDLLVDGRSTKQIARLLGNSPRTIDVHRARLLHKLGVRTLPHLVHLSHAAHLR